MENKIYLTAKEAREIASTSMAMKNHLYKQIKEEAKECRTSTFWCVEGSSENIVNKLIQDLENDGYQVERDMEDNPGVLVVKW